MRIVWVVHFPRMRQVPLTISSDSHCFQMVGELEHLISDHSVVDNFSGMAMILEVFLVIQYNDVSVSTVPVLRHEDRQMYHRDDCVSV